MNIVPGSCIDWYFTTYQTLQGQAAGQKRKIRFKHKLLSIDSTAIALSLSMFDWAQYKRSKGALKLHLVLDHDGYLPQYAVISDGKKADISATKRMSFAPETIVVFDRGYADYDWWLELTQKQVWFVTRLKEKADYAVMEKRAVPEKGNVLQDEVIALLKLAAEGQDCWLRRIAVWVEEKQEVMVFRHQPPAAGGQHDCGDLQGAVADRAVVQGAEAARRVRKGGDRSRSTLGIRDDLLKSTPLGWACRWAVKTWCDSSWNGVLIQ
jgi:hypothetical protein